MSLNLLLSIFVLCSTLVRGINDVRAASGLSALREDMRLTAVAQERASDLASRKVLSHLTQDGEYIWDITDRRAITTPQDYVGEILARTASPSDQEVVKAWEESPNHLKVMMNAHYNLVGCGEAIGADGKRYIVCVFVGKQTDS